MSKNVWYWARSWGVHFGVTASATGGGGGEGGTQIFSILLVFGFWLAKTSKIDEKFEKRLCPPRCKPSNTQMCLRCVPSSAIYYLFTYVLIVDIPTLGTDLWKDIARPKCAMKRPYSTHLSYEKSIAGT